MVIHYCVTCGRRIPASDLPPESLDAVGVAFQCADCYAGQAPALHRTEDDETPGAETDQDEVIEAAPPAQPPAHVVSHHTAPGTVPLPSAAAPQSTARRTGILIPPGQTPESAPPPQRRTGFLTPPAEPQATEQVAPRRTGTMPVANHATPAGGTPRAARASGATPLPSQSNGSGLKPWQIGAAAGGGILLLIIVGVWLFGGSKTEPRPGSSASVAAAPATDSKSSADTRQSGESTKTSTQSAATKNEPASNSAATAKPPEPALGGLDFTVPTNPREVDEKADQLLEKILKGFPKDTQDERIKKLQMLAEKFPETLAGARARREVERVLKPEPVAPPTPPTPAAKTIQFRELFAENFENFDLSKTRTENRISGNPELVNDPERGKVLRIFLTRDAGTCTLTLPLDPAVVNGRSVRVEVMARMPGDYTKIQGKGHARPRVQITVTDPGGPPGYPLFLYVEPNKPDWVALKGTAKIPSNSATVNIHVMTQESTSEAFFDDLKVFVGDDGPPPPPKASLVYAEDFEQFDDKNLPKAVRWFAEDGTVAMVKRDGESRTLHVSRTGEGPGFTGFRVRLDANAVAGKRVRLAAKALFPGKLNPNRGQNFYMPRVQLCVGLPTDKLDYPLQLFPTEATPNWQSLAAEAVMPAGIKSLEMGIGIQGTACECWFDEVRLDVLE